MKYPVRKNGEWVDPGQAFHKIACCDCGLVHLFEFRTEGKRVKFRAWRDNRATAQRRRKEAKK